MSKIWEGRTSGITNSAADDFNSSIRFDSRMYKQDITGSIAHARMLGKQGIISSDDERVIVSGLEEILAALSRGELKIDEKCEDIHMFVESELTKRIGDCGKKLHTARSRNDQVALDTRMYLKNECENIISSLLSLITALVNKAEENKKTVMPGYTHLQRAQPITYAFHLLAYCSMFRRDTERLKDAYKRIDVSPIGSCALSGTTYNTDREYEAGLLSFSDICLNAEDGVSDRDFCVETEAAISLIMAHLSRLSEEIILYTSWEFRFLELDDAYTTGSSIMPQKKNSDMAELIRGKCGRVYGNLMGTLTVLKGLPLAYNKDMQEDKEAVFDSVDTVKACLNVMRGMIETMKVNKNAMLNAAKRGFINATDLADYLTKKGMPFRSAYKISGTIVSYCIEKDITLEDMKLAEYKTFSEIFDDDLYESISLSNCIKARISAGSTGYDSVEKQIGVFKDFIKENN